MTPCISTSYIFPPIPDRDHDWLACWDGEEERGEYGYGRTEAEAIADLKAEYPEPYAERVEAACPPIRGEQVMLLRPSVNVENIMKLADFIESGEHGWGYDCSVCFLGNAKAAGITRWANWRLLGGALGITDDQALALCYSFPARSVWPIPTPQQAASILRELAVTGRLPTETEPS